MSELNLTDMLNLDKAVDAYNKKLALQKKIDLEEISPAIVELHKQAVVNLEREALGYLSKVAGNCQFKSISGDN